MHLRVTVPTQPDDESCGYTYNIKVFDPTWHSLSPPELRAKLRARRRKIRSSREKKVIGFYLEFLRLGGRVRFDDLNETLMTNLFAARKPVICGLSATARKTICRGSPWGISWSYRDTTRKSTK
jgi:hypothetical protein